MTIQAATCSLCSAIAFYLSGPQLQPYCKAHVKDAQAHQAQVAGSSSYRTHRVGQTRRTYHPTRERTR